MKEVINLVIILFISLNIFSQTIITNNDLIINHGDIILYLTDDSLSMISKHVLSYDNFLKLDDERDNRWFQDTIKSKYKKKVYLHSGYDLGHLTPSHITSYDNGLNHKSFSYLNQAPQLASFNRGKWARLERSVEDSITKYKTNSIIITGVVYNEKKPNYLKNSKIKIPLYYYKILYINNLTYCWIGSNVDGWVKSVTIKYLNGLFKSNGMEIKIK
jgi:DNA/RNA endonuclease G (NUC1)